MNKNYIIKNPSNEILIDALTTLPTSPEWVHLYFNIEGVKIPNKNNLEYGELKNYIEFCKNNEIIPFSAQNIDYTANIEKLLKENPLDIETFFGRGKVNRIFVNIREDEKSDILSAFNRIMLPALSKNNYRVSEGYIMLSGDDFFDPIEGSGGRIEGVGLYINWMMHNGLELEIKPNYKGNDKDKFIEWFEKLQNKFCL